MRLKLDIQLIHSCNVSASLFLLAIGGRSKCIQASQPDFCAVKTVLPK